MTDIPATQPCGYCGQPRSLHLGNYEAVYGGKGKNCGGYCPGPYCPECSGERCGTHQFDPCDCDSTQRHAKAGER